jgi:ABC-2 type transport system ATP-binding protein
MLEVKGVTKEFGENIAVNELSFKVENGKIYGLVGRNGAGKSTTFRMILNIIEPTSRRNFI